MGSYLKLSPNTKDSHQILSAILYKRISTSFQAIIILSERGMLTEALTQRRGMLEALFVLGALWQKPEIVEDYINNDILRRRDIYLNIQKSSKKSREAVSNFISEDELNEIIKDLQEKSKNIKYLSVKKYSCEAKLYDLFLTDYSILSEAAHHVTKDLERHIEIDDKDEIKSLIWGPENCKPVEILFPSVDHMLKAIHIVGNIFNLDTEGELSSFSMLVQKYSPKLHSNLS